MSPNAKTFFWDSCVFVTLLSKHTEQEWKDKQAICKQCLQEAIDGSAEIYISTMTIVEVYKTRDTAPGPGNTTDKTSPIPQDVQDKITKLMNQPFVKVVPADLARANEAREHIWKYSWLKPVDAMHLACASHAKVGEMFTYDGKGKEKGLLDLDEKVGTPPLKIKYPHFDGTQPLLPLGSGQPNP